MIYQPKVKLSPEGHFRERIEEIITTGNTSTTWNKAVPMFPGSWSRKEMILSCLVAIKGIQEDCTCTLVFPKDPSGEIKMKISKKTYEDYEELVGGQMVTMSRVVKEDSRIVLLGTIEVEADELMKRVVVIQKEQQKKQEEKTV